MPYTYHGLWIWSDPKHAKKKSPEKKGGNYILSLLRGYLLDFVKPNKHRVNLLIGLNEISLLPTDK